ncbi:MAG: holin, BlyA family protein [Lachnospiraceae bacterium]|nr:holin, BlyA family protein [Lachnospiraceae bacterium]
MKKIKTYMSTFNQWLLYQLNKNEQASGTLEMVLIIVVVLGILVIFRDNIEQLIQSVFAKINAQVNSF